VVVTTIGNFELGGARNFPEPLIASMQRALKAAAAAECINAATREYGEGEA
jgi:hypothetical protein